MHFVEGLGLRVAELDEAGGADGERGGLQVRNDLSREASLDRVGLDDGECEHVKGLGAKGLRGDEAANDVGARQESYHDPLPHYGEAVHVLGAHQIGDVREGLVLRQAEDGTSHRLLRRDELRIGRAALQLGARGRVKLSGLGALHEVRDQETQQLTVRDHPDERAGAVRCGSRSQRIGVAEMPIPVTRARTASVRKWGRNACSPTLTMSSGQVCRMTALRRWGSATAPAAMRRSASRSVASLTVAARSGTMMCSGLSTSRSFTAVLSGAVRHPPDAS